MIPKQPPVPGPKEIIHLLSRLKTHTPDYPAEMLTARKAVFLKEAAAIKLQIEGRGGEGGQTGGSGGAGSAAGGSTTASGIAFQALIGFGLIAAMLIGAFLINEQDHDASDKTVVLAVQENSDMAILPLTGAAPPTVTPMPTEVVPATITPELTISDPVIYDWDTEEIYDEIAQVKKLKKPNPGLHLGEADGTPAAPGQGNSGNINQPDKPEKPNKPSKPERPERPNP